MKVMILSRNDLKETLEMPKVIEGVKEVYKQKACGNTVVWSLIEHHFDEFDAVMDIRSGGVLGDLHLHGLKMLNNFPRNAKENLPTFTGILMVYDSTTGLPLGILDASYITSMRTGAAGAIGAEALARADAKNLLMFGAGRQSIFQIAAVLTLIPTIERIFVADTIDPEHAKKYVSDCRERLDAEFGIDATNVTFEAVDDLRQAVANSDIIITITPSRSPAIKKEWVKPGTHFSCIGADMAGKEEIDPSIFIGARAFADDIDQCLRVGEMEIPHAMGLIDKKDVVGEIGQVLSAKVCGRQSDRDVTIFDATGLALLDLVTAKIAIDNAKQKGIGTFVDI